MFLGGKVFALVFVALGPFGVGEWGGGQLGDDQLAIVGVALREGFATGGPSRAADQEQQGRFLGLFLLHSAPPWLDIDSYLPYEGKVVIHNKTATDLSVRIPRWVDRSAVEVKVAAVPVLVFSTTALPGLAALVLRPAIVTLLPVASVFTIKASMPIPAGLNEKCCPQNSYSTLCKETEIVFRAASAGMPELTMERWSLALVFRELNYLYELELMREWSALLPEGAL